MNSRHYSSRSLFVTLIAFLGYFSGMFTSAANDTAAMTKEELVAALKRETENFKNYSVEIEFENEEFMPGLPVSFYGSKGTLIQQAEVNDRFHYIQHVISI
ncbi:MAG: hypothetical protein KDA65_03230, partial [Planctomycetaceae bacterium]|nr:hypothetical protein [Planctomycetaceae bacterium]